MSDGADNRKSIEDCTADQFKDLMKRHEAAAAAGHPWRFIGGAFPDADFSKLNCQEAVFERCDFSGANFQRASIEGATFQDCRLEGTDFSQAALLRAKFLSTASPKASLHNASFVGADCQEALFSDVNLLNINAERADLRNARFYDAPLTGAILNSADLRDAQGIVLDQTSTRLTYFSSDAGDDWSTLRRTYTGARFALILILSAVFAATFILKALAFYVLAIASTVSIGGYSLERYCQTAGCVEQPLYFFLSGLSDGPLAVALVAFGLIYNGLRFFVTYKITALREEEDRSNCSPRLAEYAWLIPLHCFLYLAQYLALLLLALNAWTLATTPMLVPAAVVPLEYR